MRRKSRVNLKAVPDGLKPKEPATLADPEYCLVKPSEAVGDDSAVPEEEKGDHVTRSSEQPQHLPSVRMQTAMTAAADQQKPVVSTTSPVPESAQGAAVSPVKPNRLVAPTTTQEVMLAHAETINQLVDKGAQAHLELSKACLKARDEVGRKRYAEFVPLLRMSSSEFSKYCAIGKKALLHDPDLRKHLPTSFSSLYMISMLTDRDLQRAINDKKITPQSTRSELALIVPSKPPGSAKGVSSLPGPWFAAIELTPDCDEEIRRKVHEALAKLKSDNRGIVRVIDRIDLQELERKRDEERAHQDYLKQFRILARKEVKHAGKTMKGVHKQEITQIGNDADEARIREVLLLVNRESKFDELSAQARRELERDDVPAVTSTLRNA